MTTGFPTSLPPAAEPAPRAPAGLGVRGRAFWKVINADYEIPAGHHRETLVEACRVLDRLDELRQQVAQDGRMVPGSKGQLVLHPGLTEERQQRLVFVALVRQLALGDEEEDAEEQAMALMGARGARARWGSTSSRRGKR